MRNTAALRLGTVRRPARTTDRRDSRPQRKSGDRLPLTGTGRSPQEIEDQITYPLSVNLQGLAGDAHGARHVHVRLLAHHGRLRGPPRQLLLRAPACSSDSSYLGNLLPAGVTPRLGPDATGLGWVYEYYLKDTSTGTGPRRAARLAGLFRALPARRRRARRRRGRRHRRLRAPCGRIEVSALRLKQLGVALFSR